MAIFKGRRDTAFDPELAFAESALRSRTARRVRAQLRRLEPIAMLTPRWSAAQGFLEDLALDLAVGEPSIGCRTVSFRPLLGRSMPESWNFILRVLADLPGNQWNTRPLPLVVDRRGFYHAAEKLLEEAHEDAEYPVAVLGHGCEHLPVEVLEDIAMCWARYAQDAGPDRRCTVLLAGTVDTPALDVGGATKVDLLDLGEAEAAASLVMHVGATSLHTLTRAAKFSGGVPAIVTALAEGSGGAGLPPRPEDMLRCLGPLADELRGAMFHAMADPEIAERLFQLARGEPLVEEPALDRELMMAGLLRRVRGTTAQVELRSPALAAAAM